MIVHDYVTHMMKVKTLDDNLEVTRITGTYLRSGFKARKSKDFQKGDLVVFISSTRIDAGILTKVNRSSVKAKTVGSIDVAYVGGRIDMEHVYLVSKDIECYDRMYKRVEDLTVESSAESTHRPSSSMNIKHLLRQYVDIDAFLTKINRRWLYVDSP